MTFSILLLIREFDHTTVNTIPHISADGFWLDHQRWLKLLHVHVPYTVVMSITGNRWMTNKCGIENEHSLKLLIFYQWISKRVCTIVTFTHWGRDKMDTISQTIFSTAFSWMKMNKGGTSLIHFLQLRRFLRNLDGTTSSGGSPKCFTQNMWVGGEVRMRTKQQLWTNVPQTLLAHILYQQQLSSKTLHRVWEIT